MDTPEKKSVKMSIAVECIYDITWVILKACLLLRFIYVFNASRLAVVFGFGPEMLLNSKCVTSCSQCSRDLKTKIYKKNVGDRVKIYVIIMANIRIQSNK